jgi:hypothetical protein
MARRRGVRLVLVAVLSLIVWTTTGAEPVEAGSASGTGELAVHVAGEAPGGAPTALVPAPRDRSGGAARAQRLVVLVMVLVSGALTLWSPSAAVARRRHDGLPVWSGWFADPGRLRGPPAV